MPVPIFTSRPVINVADYGATGNDADYTTEITNALNAIITNYGGWGTNVGDKDAADIVYPVTVAIKNEYTIYFPPGRYRISSPIVLEGQLACLTIIGDNALIMPTNGATFQDSNSNDVFAFEHSYCYDFKMQGMNFAGFNKAVSISNPEQETAKFLIKDCSFQNNNISLAVSYRAGIGRIENSKFLNSEIALKIQSEDGTTTSADQLIIKDCWISSKNYGLSSEGGTHPHPAPIVNYGRLKMDSCVFIPSAIASDAIEPAWINNYKSITIKNARQGGELQSFTLINNFGKVGDLIGGVDEPDSIIVSDSRCYSRFSNVENYKQPAIVRYVGSIPNLTIVENNRGMVQLQQVIGFSKYLYNDNATAIQNMIQNSGPAGLVNNFNVAVKVTDNVGGLGYGTTGSLIPESLFPFVRDINYLWPYKPTINLNLIEHTTDGVTGDQLFKFEYPEDNGALLINFAADPFPAGGGQYRGGYVGILKANGFFSNASSYGPVRLALDISELFNIIGDSDPSSWPGGAFTVSAFWDATGDKYLPYATTNRSFFIRVSAAVGAEEIAIAPINGFLNGTRNNFLV